MRGRGCRETHLASDGSSSASTSALVDETGRPRGLMTCMFAMELGARGGSGDETVAIPTTMELDSIKQAAKGCGKAGTRFHSPDGSSEHRVGNSVPRFQIPSETGTREVGALLYLTHTNSDRHPHLTCSRETRHDFVSKRWREDERIFEIVEESFSTLLTHFGNVYARGSRYIIILTERRE